jgi:hypothetical protein
MRSREVRAAAAMALSGLLLGAGVPVALRAVLAAARGDTARGLIWAAAGWAASTLLVVGARRLRGRSPWTLGLEILWLMAALAGLAGARMVSGAA